mgnify:FL=1
MITPHGRFWRAGGLLLQYLPSGETHIQDLPPGDAPPDFVEATDENEKWIEGATLAATLEDHELIDPNLSGETILYRLFHERGVKVFTQQAVTEFCRCSQSRVENLLRSFSKQERAEMVGDDGVIGVTCEFCATHRSFNPEQFDE